MATTDKKCTCAASGFACSKAMINWMAFLRTWLDLSRSRPTTSCRSPFCRGNGRAYNIRNRQHFRPTDTYHTTCPHNTMKLRSNCKCNHLQKVTHNFKTPKPSSAFLLRSTTTGDITQNYLKHKKQLHLILAKFPAPLKLRPYGAIQVCSLLLLLLLTYLNN